MASKSGRMLGKMARMKLQKTAGSEGPLLQLLIKAGTASPAPPLGPQLGQRGLNVAAFCKDFNNKTAHILEAGEVVGKITVKHVYEIARVKMQDPVQWSMSMQEMCENIIKVCHRCGVQVVHSLDPAEYRTFLEQRKALLMQEMVALEEAKAAKLLRAGTTV